MALNKITSQPFLREANFYIPLQDDGLYAACFPGRLIIGYVSHNHDLLLQFGPKSLTIPADCFHIMIDTIRKALKGYNDENPMPFEDLVFERSEIYHLMGNFEKFNDKFLFQLRWAWYFKKDKYFQMKVATGRANPISTPREFLYLKTKGLVLTKDTLTKLNTNLDVLIANCISEADHDLSDKVQACALFLSQDEKFRPHMERIVDAYRTTKWSHQGQLIKDTKKLFNMAASDKNTIEKSNLTARDWEKIGCTFIHPMLALFYNIMST